MLNRQRWTLKMHSAMISAIASVLALCFLPICHAQNGAYTFVSFDAPSAGTGPGQGTYPTAINRIGWIGGYVYNSAGSPRGFLRTRGGRFIEVNPPTSVSSVVNAINVAPQAVGTFLDRNRDSHGFLFEVGGFYTQLDAPGATSTYPLSINDAGQVVGAESDATGTHAFLWTAQNQFTVFDAPGVGSGGTWATAINASGQATGYYFDASSEVHAWFRTATGHIITFDVGNGSGTKAFAINRGGEIAGSWNDGNGSQYGFARNTDGTFDLFSISGGNSNVVTSINDNGAFVGYNFSDFESTSFEGDPSGNVAKIPLPFANTLNTAVGINAKGHITGLYKDSNAAAHGWAK